MVVHPGLVATICGRRRRPAGQWPRPRQPPAGVAWDASVLSSTLGSGLAQQHVADKAYPPDNAPEPVVVDVFAQSEQQPSFDGVPAETLARARLRRSGAFFKRFEQRGLVVALRGDISFLLEIKSSVTDTIHFSSIDGKLQRQAEKMQQDCEKTQTLPIYAFRLKGQRGDTWRLFSMDVVGLQGRAKVLHNRLPKLASSKSGNYIMRWNEGLPLSDFISYLCR